MDTHAKPKVLPGCEIFEKLIESNAYYVDKTSYLKNLLESSDEVENALFTRPRRFGKTLNMSMIKAFCELDYKNPGDITYQQKLFIDNGRNLAVAQDDYKELRGKVMGQLPVIYVSFRGVEGSCFYEAVEKLVIKIFNLYEEFAFLLDNPKISDNRKTIFSTIFDFCANNLNLSADLTKLNDAVTYCGLFIPNLAKMLYLAYGTKVLILIDEYDVPLQKAVVAKEPYYDEMLGIIRDISVNTFKQDPDAWLYKGIITGCLKIAHQSVFTDANNFTTFNVNDELYSSFFGFTQEQTDKILCDFGLESKRDEIKKWYNGYRFGDDYVYCPWSLMEYCASSKRNDSNEPKPFWVNTSGNDIITLFTKNSIKANDADNIQKLQDLMDGKSVLIKLSEFSVYPDIKQGMSFDTFCTMMLQTGYVTFDENSKLLEYVSVKIPNYEIRKAFETKFLTLYSDTNTSWKNDSATLLDAIMSADAKKTHELINQTLQTYISIRHSGYEQYYHGFMLGLLIAASASKNLEIIDEGESGNGYYDLAIRHKFNNIAAIIEFKVEKDKDLILKGSSQKALSQIIEKKYAMQFFKRGCDRVICIGMAFRQKECQLIIQTITDEGDL